MVQQIVSSSVQQFASKTPEPAASALPFNLSQSTLGILGAQNEARQSFNSELMRQTQEVRVFEQPRQRPDAHTNSRENTTVNRDTATVAREHNNNEQSARSQSSGATHDENSATKMREERSQSAFEQRMAQRKEDQLQKQKNERQDTSTIDTNKPLQQTQDPAVDDKALSSSQTGVKSVTSQATQPANESSVESNPNSENVASHKWEEQSPLHTAKQDESISEYASDAFDYIDYVTALADFNGTSTDGNAILEEGDEAKNPQSTLLSMLFSDTEEKALLDEQEIPSEALPPIDSLLISRDMDSVDEQNTLAALHADGNQDSVERQSIINSLGISADDAQKLANAAQIAQNGSNELAYIPQSELDDIISQLADKLALARTGNEQLNDADIVASDKALLQTLLLGLQSDKQSADDSLEGSDVVSTDAVKAHLTIDPVGNKTKNIQTDAKPVLTLLSGGLENTSNKLELAQGTDGTDLNALANKLPEKILVSELPVVPTALTKEPSDSKSPQTGILAMQSLADLTELQSKSALENLNQRLQAVTTQLSGESKGNEFIMALQSGVKEFKEQLAQGREPGIDLKAMVAEAMAQITGESVKGLQPKIDAATSQFSNALQVASALSASVNQLQGQAISMTDAQLAKESNAMQVEGTKLANSLTNSVTSQLNAQASVDKAINIFKAEGQNQLAEKVRWMVNARNATAEIRLDPADLGGINIKINISGDTAQVNFNVQSVAAKEALDLAAPRLREMLQDQGIELGQSSVQQDSQGSSQQNANDGEGSATTTPSMIASNDAGEEAVEHKPPMHEQRIVNGAIGGIDYYA